MFALFTPTSGVETFRRNVSTVAQAQKCKDSGLEGGSDFLDFTALGWHTGEDWNRLHTDCDEDLGDPVYTVANGTITAAGLYGDPAGNTILIVHSLPDGGTIWSIEFIGNKCLDRIDRIDKMKSTRVNPVNPVYFR